MDYYREGTNGPHNYKNDKEFKAMAATTDNCHDLISFMENKGWVSKNKYWQCISDTVEFKCVGIEPYPPQF